MAEDLDVEELLEATYNKTGIKEEGQDDHYGNNNHSRPGAVSDDDDGDDRRRRKKKKHRRSRSRSGSRSRSPKRRRRSKSRSRSPRRRSRSRSPRRRKTHSRSPRRRRSKSRSRSPRRRSRSRERYNRRRSYRSRSRDRERRKRSRSHDRGPTYDKRGYRPASPIPMPPPPPPPRRQRSPDLEPPSIERDRRTVMCMQLAAEVNNKNLGEFFADCGTVKEAHVIQDRQSRRSKGIAYVEFESEASIPSALMLSGRKLFGVPIIIQPTQSEKNRLAAAAQNLKKAEGPKKVYVGSLHYNINEDMLKAIFSPFGQIDRITVMRDTDTNISRGYAFVDFRDGDAADKAIANLNGLELAGRAIKVGNITTGADNVMTIDSLDGEDSDVGVGMTPQSRMALMAKLAAGHNTELPVPSVPNVPSVPTISSCFIISGMFDPAKEAGNSWDKEIREDVLEECQKFGNVLHVAVDKFSQGNVYVKCHTPQVASAAMKSFNGRYYAGKQVVASLVNESTYHLKYPGALAATTPI